VPPKGKFVMPPIPNNSQRYSLEMGWLKKANPEYFEGEKKRELRDMRLLIKKRDQVRLSSQILLGQ